MKPRPPRTSKNRPVHAGIAQLNVARLENDDLFHTLKAEIRGNNRDRKDRFQAVTAWESPATNLVQSLCAVLVC